MDETDVHPLRDQRRLALGHVAQQREEALRRAGEVGIVSRDRVVRELAHALDVAARGVELERPDADVARRHARQHRARQHVFAIHGLPGRNDGQGARRGNAERVHRLADQHFAQHRTDGRLAVAAAGKRRAARSLERDVAAVSLPVDHLAEKERATVAELGREAAELMARIRLGERLGAFGQRVPRRTSLPSRSVTQRSVV